MAKKAPAKKEEKVKERKEHLPKLAEQQPGQQLHPQLTKEQQEKLKDIKDKLEKFKSRLLEKFETYVSGIALMPPEKPKTEGEKPDLNKINTLVLIDDSDSQKMSKQELKAKLEKIIVSIAKDIDKELVPNVLILSELWGSCYDGKYDLLQMIALSAPVYEKGMLSAIKIAEVHKTMVLKKFEKYIVSYVLAGSLVQGRATPQSDIDVWIVIDDTDVKKMTRAELKDKLRAIIIGMGIEAGDITGIKNKINIQVYILTDFWDSLKEANPIIFTLLRDGVPFYDRGMFMPWKQLLRMGKIKPSAEAIDMFMGTGDQMLKRVKYKMKEIGMEDIYYAILTPSQAALMMFGIPPPSPRETAELMNDIFVKKEKMLEEEYIKTLDRVIKVRKDLEHGTLKEITGQEIDELLKAAEKYLERIQKLFKDIENVKESKDFQNTYDTISTVIRDALVMEGVDKVAEQELFPKFEAELVTSGKLPAHVMSSLKEITKAKMDYEANKLTKPEVEKTKKEARKFVKSVIEYMQRKRGRDMERCKIKVKYQNKYGEVLLLEKEAFITIDIDAKEKDIQRAEVAKDGSLMNIRKAELAEMEQALAKAELPKRVFIREKLFEHLKSMFGKDVEILMHY